MRKILTTLALLLLLIITPVGFANNDAKKVWKDVIKKCATSDLLGKKVLFFGLSNTAGPGSILRKRASTEGGGYGFRWSLEDLEPNSANWPELFTKPPANLVGCSGTSEKKTNIKAGLVLESVVVPLTGGLSVDFNRAKKVTVGVQHYKWDTLDEGPFVLKIDSLPTESRIRQDLNRPDRLVITRALKVKGITADLEFTSGDALALQGKYNDQAPVRVGDVTFNASWTGSGRTTLHLESPAESYLAGELSSYRSIGFSGSTSRLQSMSKVETNARVVREVP